MNFKGVLSPDIYIIDFHCDEDEMTKEYPLLGTRGDFMNSLLGSFSLLDKVRVANWSVQGKSEVIDDIIKSSPKLIIGLGSEAVNEFIDTNRKITDLSGNIYDIKLDSNGEFYEYKMLLLTSPTYVLYRIDNPEVSLKFSKDLYVAFQYINDEYVDILEEKEILSAHTFEEFKEVVDNKLLDDDLIAYDIETNARPPMMEGSEIIGFSISNKTSGVYVSHDSLEFHMSQEETDKIWNYFKEKILYDDSKKLIIQNTMYERPYTLYCKDYEIGYEKAEDTLVMARLLRGPKESAGLKFQAQKNLHYPDWETDLGRWISGVQSFINRIGLGPKKFEYLYEEFVNSDDVGVFEIESLDSYIDLWFKSYKDISSKEVSKLSRKEKLDIYLQNKSSVESVDITEINNLIDKMHSVVVDLYTEDEVHNLGLLIKNNIIEAVNNGGVKDSVIPYNWIPDRVLSKYGAVDSIATYDLYDFFTDMMDKESTDKVDLHKGYENWKEHMYVAYIMERNGMYWNDELAQRDREFLVNQSTECLRAMLLSPLFSQFILPLCGWKYKPVILSDYLPNIAKSQGYEVSYDRDTEKYKVYQNGKRVAKGNIDLIETDNNPEYCNLVENMFVEEVNSADSYEELKSLYNPSSSTSSHIPRGILMTKDIQYGGIINKLHTLSTSPEFEDIKDQLPNLDQKFLSIPDLLCDHSKLKEIYGSEWSDMAKKLYQGFCRLIDSHSSLVTTPEIVEVLSDKNPVVIESFDDGGIISVYDNLMVQGFDQDNEDTWDDVFRWMVNFRLYKKSSKIISSYIDGSVGRQSVAVVDKKEVRSGSHKVGRKRMYYEDGEISPTGKVECKPDEDYLLMAKWSPNTAETGRWRSAMHTVPWGSQVKKYYTSRFEGGTTCCPDYSQMEVRTLAAISKDKNMLELFHSGKDFHTETAKSIYRKDEVTPAERRFSKTATFSLLYGAMESSFANNYCKGDMEYARMVYGGFFEAYPDVKKWVDERHEEVQRDHRVSLELSNRFISIPMKGEGQSAINSMLRKAQNYPIQAQSADLTGCVIFDLQKYIEENNLKSLVFMYVHDSIEVDIYPFELLQFIAKLKVLLNESPMRRMGLPSKADVALGKSLGHEIELEDIKMNDDMTEGWLTLNGFKDEIDETVDVWKSVYDTVEVYDEDYKENYVSMGDLFILKKAYTPTIHTMRYKGGCKVHIKYYED